MYHLLTRLIDAAKAIFASHPAPTNPGKPPRHTRLGCEAFEERLTPAVVLHWYPATGLLTAQIVNASSPHEFVVGRSTNGYFTYSPNTGNVPVQTNIPCWKIRQITVVGSIYDDNISLTNVNTSYFQGLNGRVRVYGMGGNDRIAGSQFNDVIRGGDGNDTIWGSDGNDILYGDNGNDVMTGELGNDYMYGGSGNDDMSGGYGNDLVYGDTGNDKVYGDYGNDVLSGGILRGERDDVRGGGDTDRWVWHIVGKYRYSGFQIGVDLGDGSIEGPIKA